jgi:hypothetical protein
MRESAHECDPLRPGKSVRRVAAASGEIRQDDVLPRMPEDPVVVRRLSQPWRPLLRELEISDLVAAAGDVVALINVTPSVQQPLRPRVRRVP